MHDVEALRRENAEQRRENALLRGQITRLTEQLGKLSERVAELLVVAQRQQRKPSAEKPPVTPPAVAGEAKRAFDERPKAPTKPNEQKVQKPRAAPTGRKPLPRHLELEEHALRGDACTHCGSAALDAADEVVEEKLRVVKEHQRRRVVRRTTCRWRDCGGRTTPRSLPAPYERAKVTCEWLAWLVYSKFALLTPLDRIRRDLAERGIPLAMSTLVSLIERAADLLSPVDGHHWRSLLAGSWMATDGTGLKVLIPKLPAAHDGYIELYRNRELAVFQYEPDKRSEHVLAKLRSFRGTLTADAEQRFNAVFVSGDVTEAGCNAHGRRKCRDAEETQPALAAEGGAFIGAMYGEEEEAQKLGLVGDALREHRQRRIRPIADEFMRWIAAVEPTLLPSEPLMAAVRYYKNHGDALFRFIDDPEVPIDNSPTEREFQNVAKLRVCVREQEAVLLAQLLALLRQVVRRRAASDLDVCLSHRARHLEQLVDDLAGLRAALRVQVGAEALRLLGRRLAGGRGLRRVERDPAQDLRLWHGHQLRALPLERVAIGRVDGGDETFIGLPGIHTNPPSLGLANRVYVYERPPHRAVIWAVA